jgi:hypothetical protein
MKWRSVCVHLTAYDTVCGPRPTLFTHKQDYHWVISTGYRTVCHGRGDEASKLCLSFRAICEG